MVPAAAVIPAPIAYIKVVAVKKLVVESVCHSVSSPLAVFNWHYVRSAEVPPMTRRAASGKPKLLGSGGSMVAKLKLKGIDGRAPPGVEPAA
ncbi:hypothetical protein ANTRET_LOCUS11154 [Anthophora retusa]